MGKSTQATRGRVARTTRRVREMVVDVLLTVIFFIGAVLVGAVVVYLLIGDDDDV